jgi:predicted dehydrogenase
VRAPESIGRACPPDSLTRTRPRTPGSGGEDTTVLKVGVIGVGHLGRFHTRVYSEIPSCELVGVYDTDPERAALVANEYGTRAFPDLDELLEGIDAASIAVPTSAHHETGLKCLERGTHVLIEKPIATTADEARDLVRAARDAGLKIQVGHIERFNPAMRAALSVLRKPMFVEAHRLGIFVPRGTDVAVVLDLMIHDIDLILSAVDSPVESIDAMGVPVLSPSIDIANARLKFADGCVANVTASRVSRERMRKIRFFQHDAYVSVDCMKPQTQIFRRKDVPPETLLKIATGQIEGGLEDIVEYEEPAMDGADSLMLELGSFLDAVETGGRPPVDGEDGLKALEVALEILRQIGPK